MTKIATLYYPEYHISIGEVDHSLLTPYELTITDIDIRDKAGNKPYFSANKLVIGLDKKNTFQVQHFEYVRAENGYIDFTAQMKNAFSTDLFQLINIDANYDTQDNNLAFEKISGGVQPWSMNIINDRADCDFNFTAEKIVYNNLNIQSVMLQGKQKKKRLITSNLGGKINQGFFIARISIPADNSLDIQQLKIDNINFQTSIDSLMIDHVLNAMPKITLDDISVLNSTIALPSLLIENANLNATQLIYHNQLQLDKSNLTFSADRVMWNNELIEQPLFIWKYQDDQIVLEQILVTWNNSKIKSNGTWQNQKMTLDSLIATGMRYELPENWYHKLIDFSLPAFVDDLSINQLTLMPSLLIDTNPELPFQFTAFEAFSNNLHLTRQNDKIFTTGEILFKATSGTLNSIELYRPDLTIKLTPNRQSIKLSTLIGNGIVEGSFDLNNGQDLSSFNMSGNGIESTILSKWHLINNAPWGNKFSFDLNGQYPSQLNGQLQINNNRYSILNSDIIQ